VTVVHVSPALLGIAGSWHVSPSERRIAARLVPMLTVASLTGEESLRRAYAAHTGRCVLSAASYKLIRYMVEGEHRWTPGTAELVGCDVRSDELSERAVEVG
jgi:hypothetical protein